MSISCVLKKINIAAYTCYSRYYSTNLESCNTRRESLKLNFILEEYPLNLFLIVRLKTAPTGVFSLEIPKYLIRSSQQFSYKGYPII